VYTDKVDVGDEMQACIASITRPTIQREYKTQGHVEQLARTVNEQSGAEGRRVGMGLVVSFVAMVMIIS
jgi:hypothetical protein